MKSIYIKILAILNIFSLTVAIMIAHMHPAVGYEVDIYASTPASVWIFIILGFLSGISIILYEVITKNYESSRMWLLGLSIIILSKITLLYLPYIRDYIGWHGDNIGYLGMIKDLIQAGHFPAYNFYPITHIFLAGIIFVTGVPDRIIANLSTTLISLLFIFFIYLLAGSITHNKRIQILAVLVAGVVQLAESYNVILAPNGWSILFMPLLLALYLKSNNREYRLLFILILVIYPLFHPLSSLIVIIALFTLELVKWLFPLLFNKYFSELKISSSRFVITFVVIELVIFSYWILAHQGFNANIKLFWDQVTSGMGSGKVVELTASLNKINIHGFDFYILLFKMFGADILLLILSGVGIFWILGCLYTKKMLEGTGLLLPLACFLVICGFLYIAYLIGLPGTGALGTGQWDRRLLGYVDIILPLFSAFGFITLLSIFKFSRLNLAIVSVLILSPSILSIAALFPSPYIHGPNLQITSMEMTGTRWLIDSKNVETGCTFIMSPPCEFGQSLLGYDQANLRTDLGTDVNKLRDHFGYTGQFTLGVQYPQNYYISITQYDRTIYSTVWEEVGRFNDVDYKKLNLDATVSKLYSNRGMDFYYIKSSIAQ